MECQYCKKVLCTLNSLKVHQTKTKSCLKIQGKPTKGEFICKCGKSFTQKHHLLDHQTICVSNGTYITELINDNEKYKQQLLLLSQQVISLQSDKLNLQERYDHLAETLAKSPVNITNNIVNNLPKEVGIEMDIESDDEEKPEEYKLKPLDVGDGYQIENRESDGYINVTNLCKAGGKKFNDWKRLNKTFDFLTILSNATGIPAASLIQYQTGYGSTQGTWVHPQVAINIAQWISPQFDVKVSSWVYEIMMTGKIDITNTKSYKELVEENKGHKIQIQKLNNKYVKQQPRVQYKESNVIYILTTKLLKKERRYILGKATNLTNRLSTYNKSDEHDVVYYQECPDVESMSVVETMVFQRLKKHREQANRERFILPKGEHIDLFRDVINEAIEFVMKER